MYFYPKVFTQGCTCQVIPCLSNVSLCPFLPPTVCMPLLCMGANLCMPACSCLHAHIFVNLEPRLAGRGISKGYQRLPLEKLRGGVSECIHTGCCMHEQARFLKHAHVKHVRARDTDTDTGREIETQMSIRHPQVVGISTNPMEKIKEFKAQYGLAFPMLSDRECRCVCARACARVCVLCTGSYQTGAHAHAISFLLYSLARTHTLTHAKARSLFSAPTRVPQLRLSSPFLSPDPFPPLAVPLRDEVATIAHARTHTAL